MQYMSLRYHHRIGCKVGILIWMIHKFTTICLQKRSFYNTTSYTIQHPVSIISFQRILRQQTSLSSVSNINNLDDLFNEVLNTRTNSSTTDAESTSTSETQLPPKNGDNGSILKENSTSNNNGWRLIDWNDAVHDDNLQSDPQQSPSPVDIVMIRDRLVYIKRDDQARLLGSQVNGNKARKMLSLQCMDSTTFPSCVVSYGGPQSNSMLAIAAIVQYHNTQLEQQFYNTNIDTIDKDDRTNNFDNDMMKDEDDRATDDDDDHTIHPKSSSSSFVRRRFIYYTKKLPSFLQKQPSGNLFRALSLGMELIEISHDEYNRLFASNDSSNYILDNSIAPIQLHPPIYGDSVWIPQGGACSMAIRGTERLAQEIYEYWKYNGNNQPLSVCIPGGTCSTALLVHRALQRLQATKEQQNETQLDIQVVVIPCVGGEYYAQRQMMYLNTHVLGANKDKTDTNKIDIVSNSSNNMIPSILRPTPISEANIAGSNSNSNNSDYFRFGQPHPMILQTFLELRDEYDIVVDLIYGAPSWTILFRHWTSSTTTTKISTSTTKTFNPDAPLDGRRIMYVHSGGVEGINSQLLRYKHMNLIDIDEIQLPGRNAQYPQNPTASS